MNTEQKGYVYLLGDYNNEGIYKIGVTRGKIENRIKKLQTGNSGEIYLIKSFETYCPFFIERLLHKTYQFKKVLNEWFELTKEEIDNFETKCTAYQKLYDINEEIKKNMEPFSL